MFGLELGYVSSLRSFCTINYFELNSLALFCITQMVDEELLASLSLELLAVDFYNRVHLL